MKEVGNAKDQHQSANTLNPKLCESAADHPRQSALVLRFSGNANSLHNIIAAQIRTQRTREPKDLGTLIQMFPQQPGQPVAVREDAVGDCLKMKEVEVQIADEDLVNAMLSSFVEDQNGEDTES